MVGNSFTITTAAFSVLCACYVIQFVLATRLVKRPERLRLEPDNKQFTIKNVMSVYDNGPRNNFWTFGVLAIFLPVVLAFVTSLFLFESYPFDVETIRRAVTAGLEGYQEVERDIPIEFLTERIIDRYQVIVGRGRSSEVIELCVAVIIVLITLELSHIHSLRKIDSEWTSMLIVASALDFATLLTIIYSISTGAADTLQLFMAFVTFAAFCSTFYILAYARVSELSTAAGFGCARSESRCETAKAARRTMGLCRPTRQNEMTATVLSSNSLSRWSVDTLGLQPRTRRR